MVYNVSLCNPTGNSHALIPIPKKKEIEFPVNYSDWGQYKQPVRYMYIPQKFGINNSQNSLISIIQAKDSYTAKHSKDVQTYAEAFATHLGIRGYEFKNISHGAALHDIGKIGIPDNILNSNKTLTDEQYAKLKEHPEIGCKLLQQMPAFSGPVSKIVKHHHEHWDGTGYPSGLSGDKIPLGSRIVAILDSYDAMTTDRPYRKGMPKEAAIERLQEGAGKQWDPSLIKEFSKILPMI